MTKVTIDRALIEQALEAFERIDAWFKVRHFVGLVPQEVEIATSLRAALAEPAVEPVAWRVHPATYGVGHDGVYALTTRTEQVDAWRRKGWDVEPLYTSPPPPAEPAQSAMRVVGRCPKTNEPCQSNCDTPCAVKPVPLLSDEEMWQLWNAQGDDAMDQVAAIAFARAIEQLVRRKAGLK